MNIATSLVGILSILAVGSVIYTLVAPDSQTVPLVTSGFKGLTSFAKVSQGRG